MPIHRCRAAASDPAKHQRKRKKEREKREQLTPHFSLFSLLAHVITLPFSACRLIISWIFALNSGRALAFNLAYLLSGILALSYLWSWNSTRAIRINRHTRARRSQVGQYFEESFEVRNQGRLPKLWLEVRDFSTVPFHGASRVLSHLKGRSRHRWQVRTYCQQRGYFRLGPMRLFSGDPLGLFSVDQTLSQTSDLIVYPATVSLAAFSLPPPIWRVAKPSAAAPNT